jgi:hypothetical protein
MLSKGKITALTTDSIQHIVAVATTPWRVEAVPRCQLKCSLMQMREDFREERKDGVSEALASGIADRLHPQSQQCVMNKLRRQLAASMRNAFDGGG